jgi:hypothetical protein
MNKGERPATTLSRAFLFAATSGGKACFKAFSAAILNCSKYKSDMDLKSQKLINAIINSMKKSPDLSKMELGLLK